MSPPLWELLDRFLAGELTLGELASALDDVASLAATVGWEDAELLRGLGAGDSDRGAVDVVRGVYDHHRPGRLAADRAARIARGMLDGSINVAAGARALARERAGGAEWIPEAFSGIAEALDATPSARGSDALAARLDEARRRAAALRAPALVAARRLLETLDGE